MTNWTDHDTYIVCYGYKNNLSAKDIQKILPHLTVNSIKMKYSNCLFLDKGNVKSSLYNASKMHRNVWDRDFK